MFVKVSTGLSIYDLRKIRWELMKSTCLNRHKGIPLQYNANENSKRKYQKGTERTSQKNIEDWEQDTPSKEVNTQIGLIENQQNKYKKTLAG